MHAVLPFPDISPDLFSFQLLGVTVALRWYALAYIVGLVLAWRWVVGLMRRPQLWRGDTAPMEPKKVEDLLTWVIFGVILGGRLGFVFFYQPAYYLANPQEILLIWQGGMSFHGGFLGVVIAGILYCRRHKLPVASIGDSFAVTVGIGLFFGRVANFINAELWGRQTEMPWGVVFPGTQAQTCPIDWTAICARHPSQLYEAALEGLLLIAIMVWLAHFRGWLKTPGALIGVFMLVYGLARSFIELFRQADAQFANAENPMGYVIQITDSFGLTMGQSLSLPMALLGLLTIFVVRAKK